jgi:tellurite resistance protein TerC
MLDHDKRIHLLGQVRWLIIWILAAIAFNIGILFVEGELRAQEFLAGYLTELSLSIDNVFVFLMIFRSFKISEHAQHRVLAWGIIGAVILRFVFIFFGIALITTFEWVVWVFGAFLVVQGVRMWLPEKEKDPHDSIIIRTVAKIFPMTKDFHGDKFVVVENGKKMITPLLAVLVLIEGSDIIFAVDSVPAVLSISTDLFVVYTSNIFAILCLRQLFFVIEHLESKFEYVKYGVAFILVFTGVKMLGTAFGFHIPTFTSIIVIAGILFLSIVISSIIASRK